MPEAEDVIVDAARQATAYAMDLWRRNRHREAADAGTVFLVDVRTRLELLVEAALGTPIPIRIAHAPPPPTVLSRLFDRGRRPSTRVAVPAGDGVAIYLPAQIEGQAGLYALDLYRVAALHQALRCMRGTADCYPWAQPLLVQDLYLVSETRAAHADLLLHLPGLSRMANHAWESVLSVRSASAYSDEAAAVEALYRAFAAGSEPAEAIAVTPRDSLRWAEQRASAWAAQRYRGLERDFVLGTVLQADSAAAPSRVPGGPEADAAPRTSQLAGRPRARRAKEGEDDEHTGPWMIQTSQPSEHVEDAMGLQRPVDQSPDADLEGTADSISDLDSLRLVSSPGRTREILTTEDGIEARGARADLRPAPLSNAIAYPEWDYTVGTYRERATTIRLVRADDGPVRWAEQVLERNRVTLTRVRRRFEALRSRRAVQRAQRDGDELDLDAFVTTFGDRRARLPRDDRLYLLHRPARRDFVVLLLIDVSGSTDAWIGGERRAIDLEKEALVIVSTALDALGVRFAIQAFSGHGPQTVRVRDVKHFSDDGAALARRISALEPDEYTRSGAAVRHGTATLMREPAARRLLLVLSDGKPNDCDRYEGRYGIEDTRQALAEARLQGIAAFCMTVDQLASRHLRLLFGAGNYTVVHDPRHLTAALLDWLRAVAVSLR